MPIDIHITKDVIIYFFRHLKNTNYLNILQQKICLTYSYAPHNDVSVNDKLRM
jgi:hypothetical protein